MDTIIDLVMTILMTVVTLFLILFLVVFGFSIVNSFRTFQNCNRFENKIEWQPAYTGYMFSGKTMIPMYYPGHVVERSVCVEPKKYE